MIKDNALVWWHHVVYGPPNFAASVEPRSKPAHESAAYKCYERSQAAYGEAKLLGSPAKDVMGDTQGKLVGAFVNSGTAAPDRGLCTVGAPPMKHRTGAKIHEPRWQSPLQHDPSVGWNQN